MTSEGHYAGSQPAEATSGGPESEGFPPDSDGQRISGRASAPAPADGFPSSYGPPPQATPNGGSPFVVPAVPTFGQGPDAPRPATGTSYGSARVPTPEEGSTLPQRNPAPAPQAGESGALPQRGAASPYGSVPPGDSGGYSAAAPASPFGPAQNSGPSSVFGTPPSGPSSSSEPPSAPAEPQSVWGPPPTSAGPPADQSFIQRPGAPLPQRNANPGSTVDSLDGFDGFAAAASRGSADQEPAEPAPVRPPGVSAFGDQRVRVPGATLADLPDSPPPARPSDDSGGFPLRGPSGGGTAFPTRRGDSGGFPLRNAPAEGAEQPQGAPAELPVRGPQGAPAELPVRGQQGPFGAPTGSTSDGFNAFNGAAGPGEEIPPHPYGRPEPFADPFGRSPSGPPAEAQPVEQSFGDADGLSDPFGRGGESGGQPPSSSYGSAPAFGSARPPASFGQPDGDFGSARPPASFGQPDGDFGSATPENNGAVFGSARPASPYGTPEGDPETSAPVFGSARPSSPYDTPEAGPETSAPVFGSARPAPSYGDPETSAPVFGSARPSSPYDTPEGDPNTSAPVFGSARPGSPYGTPESNPETSAPVFGSPHPAGTYGQPDGVGSDDARASSPTYGSARPASPFDSGQQDDDSSPFGAQPDPAASPFGVVREPGATFGAAQPFTSDDDQSGDDHALYRRPGQSEDNPNGYPQRVPGAALGALSSPAAPGSVPAPRDPGENPAAVGSARPVTASASVPTANRTAPVDPAEIPPPTAAPQARVYGRPASAEPADDEAPSYDAEPGSGADDAPFAARPADDSPGQGVFGSPTFPGYPNDPGNEPRGSGIIPQSPARASARVGPTSGPTGMPSAPEPAAPGSLYSDLPGPPPRSGEPYSELTTDIANRDQQPYVPAPALPPMPPGLGGFDSPGQPGSNGFGSPSPNGGFGPDNGPGGAFPGSTSRATVTPPTPEDTTSWPGVEADQGRFDSFKSEAKAAKPETPPVRMLPILVSVVLGAIVLLGIVFGIVYLVAGGNDDSLSVIQGECVKQEGEAAVKVECSDATAFQVVSIVDDRAKCADPGQPAVINKDADGKNQILCLKPKS